MFEVESHESGARLPLIPTYLSYHPHICLTTSNTCVTREQPHPQLAMGLIIKPMHQRIKLLERGDHASPISPVLALIKNIGNCLSPQYKEESFYPSLCPLPLLAQGKHKLLLWWMRPCTGSLCTHYPRAMCSLLMQRQVKPVPVTLPTSRGTVQVLEEETRSQCWPRVQATLSKPALATWKVVFQSQPVSSNCIVLVDIALRKERGMKVLSESPQYFTNLWISVVACFMRSPQ